MCKAALTVVMATAEIYSSALLHSLFCHSSSVTKRLVHTALHAFQASPVMVLMHVAAQRYELHASCWLQEAWCFACVVLVQQHESPAMPLTASAFWHKRQVAYVKAWHCVVTLPLFVKLRKGLCMLQAHNVQLGLAEMTVVACTATLAAVGAAAIPSAGLVTMLMVMQAVSLDQFASDLAVILAIDWLLDRCRTAVNVLGDAFGVVVIDSLCKQDDSRTQHSEASSRPLAGSVSGVTQLEMC